MSTQRDQINKGARIAASTWLWYALALNFATTSLVLGVTTAYRYMTDGSGLPLGVVVGGISMMLLDFGVLALEGWANAKLKGRLQHVWYVATGSIFIGSAVVPAVAGLLYPLAALTNEPPAINCALGLLPALSVYTFAAVVLHRGRSRYRALKPDTDHAEAKRMQGLSTLVIRLYENVTILLFVLASIVALCVHWRLRTLLFTLALLGFFVVRLAYVVRSAIRANAVNCQQALE